MKAILEFDLNEDRSEYDIYSKAMAMHSVIFEFKQELRSIVKHGFIGNKEMNGVEHEIADKIYQSFLDKLIEEGLNDLF